jgi:hypothetical protein
MTGVREMRAFGSSFDVVAVTELPRRLVCLGAGIMNCELA